MKEMNNKSNGSHIITQDAARCNMLFRKQQQKRNLH